MVKRWLRAIVLVGAALALASCVRGDKRPAPQAPTAERSDYSSWPHEGSDVKPDPAVRYGVLANGMRYAVMRNATPEGTISLRLRIAAGAFQESDAQRGLAHFMEHMAFNGSKNVPEGEFVKLLQRKGLAFGAHTNAYTSTDETVYQLELPKNDADLIDTGLMLFREIGDRLTLDAQAIERERGVVLSELRTRNTPEYRAFEARWRLVFEGQRRADRLPIGTEQTIRGATRELLEDYYRRHYRPERTLLIATGDFDPAVLEAQIQTKFSDWQAQGAPTKDPVEGPIKQRGLTAASHTEANLPEGVSISWLRPANDPADTLAERELNAKRNIAFAIVNRRLGRIARESNAPFVGAGAGWGSVRGTMNTTSLSASSRPGQWRTALAAAEQELRRAVEHGFEQSEVDREIKNWRAGLEDAVAKATTRSTPGLANAIAGDFSGRDVFTHPKDDLAHFEKYAQSLTPEVAQHLLRQLVDGQGPVVFVTSATPIEGGNPAIAAVFDKSRATAVAANKKEKAKAFPYANFGKPGQVAERKEVADLGATLLRFSNGVKLNVKRTDFEKDTIHVNVRLAGGYVHMPRDRVGLDWALAFAFTEGGLNKLTADELEESLAGRIVGADLDMDEEAFAFSGSTNGRDLQLQMQLIAAYVTDPAYRSNGLERLQAAAETYIKQYSSGPGRVLSRELPAILRSGDARWAFPSIKQMKALKIADVRNVMKPLLDAAPIEITIVGDVSVDDASAAVAATFGALRPRADQLAEPPGARDVRFPAQAKTLRLEHEGKPDQASAYTAWAAPDFVSNPRRARTISLLREMMRVRLVDEFREAQGATYSPSVGSWHSAALPEFGFIAASAETRPDLVEGFFRTLNEIVEEMKTGKVTDDVLLRARAPVIKNAEKARLTNGYWAGALEDAQTAVNALDIIRSQISDLKSITKDEISAAARTYLDKARRVDIRVLPSKAAVAAKTTDPGALDAKQLPGENTKQLSVDR